MGLGETEGNEEETMNENTITCVYCGYNYPENTPTSNHERLTEHIKTCEKHPLRDSENKIEVLKNALIGLIGASTLDELEEMEFSIRSITGPESDKAVAINAIDALKMVMK